MHSSFSAKSYLLLLGIAVIWGSQYIFNQVVIQELPPLTLAAGRACIGTLTLTLIGIFMPRQRQEAAASMRTLWPTYALLAFFEALLPLCLLSWGQTHVASSIASILMGTIPIFTLFLAPAFVQGKHWSAPAIASVISGFVGIIILVSPNLGNNASGSLAGECAILGASASVSVSLLLFNRLGDLSPVIAVRNILGIAALPLLLLSLLLDQPWQLHFSVHTLGALAILGIFCAGIVYLMFARLIQLSGSVFTSLSNYLTPLVGVLAGGLIAGESVGLHAWLALAFIALALLANQPALISRLLRRTPISSK
jgi:drug/metabolite transporter (DMT)-like permease